ncbi:MAG TPA: STAS domain-containing protein [Bryobacteraceae bacterium]
MANTFSVARSQEGDVSILALTGYLDAYTAPQFEKSIQEEFDNGRVRIVVDCAGLTYISSAGLGVFMSFIEDVRDARGDIKICAVVPAVYQVFEILGFPELFEIVPGRADAISRFSAVSGQEA